MRLLVAIGYGSGLIVDLGKALVGRTGNGGIDGVIDPDTPGLDRIYMQAKRYGDGNTVGALVIRDFFGSLDRFKRIKACLSPSAFSPGTRQTSEQLSLRIVLIDGDQLTRLMIRHGARVPH